MKVGIMTWFTHYNYGTSFQVTALNNVIKKIGHYPMVINYLPRGIIHYNDKPRKIIFKKVKNKIKRFKVNEQKFRDFLYKNIQITQSCNSFPELQSLNNEFDAFVCGSDQIWSPLCFDDKYFLNFADKKKIIAYAPSIGVNNIDNEIIKNKMSKLIKRFNYLSVREKTGKNIINEISGIDASVVLDPTLLLEKEEWLKLADNNDIKNGDKYIFCYFLGYSNKYIKKVKQIAKIMNLKIINIPTHKHEKINKYNLPYDIGPDEFLKLLNNAELVITDSFHATIFSINFNKNFYCFKRFKDNDENNQNSRVLDILDTFGLNERLLDYNKNKFNFSEIDYTNVNDKLLELRNMSLKFLTDSFEKVERKDEDVKETKGFICEYCSGCGACVNVCPKNAVKIIKNDEGFYQYRIEKDKCIGCNLCKKVCPMLNINTNYISDTNELYSYKSNSIETLKKSSSGGFAYDVCKYYNEKGYYICGATYNKIGLNAEHIIIDKNNKENLLKIQGSKYVQSTTLNCFSEICDLSKENKIVFTGTPCQVAGLSRLLQLKGNRENVTLIEIICHGVPSYKLWEKYLKELRKKYGEKENNIIFRDKSKSWRNRRILIKFKNKKYINDDRHDMFYAFFRRSAVDNNSCYECPYRIKSYADIRIGDYWGNKYIKDSTGVSMLICISEKGKSIVNEISKIGLGEVTKGDINDFFKYQHTKNLNPPIFREELIERLDSDVSLKKLRKEYLSFVDFKEKISKIISKVRRG